MNIIVPFIYKASIIKPRCRKPTAILVRDSIEVTIKEVNESELPVAFRVGEHLFRYYNDSLWLLSNKAIRNEEPQKVTLNEVITNTMNPNDYKYSCSGKAAPFKNFWGNIEPFTERTNLSYASLNDVIPTKENIIAKTWVSDNRDDVVLAAKNIAKKILSMNGVMLNTVSEPRYVINTFGCGKNFSAAMFIVYGYSENISNRCYFNALEFNAAQAFLINKTPINSVVAMPNCGNIIEVFINSAVKCQPKLDHVA